MTPEVRRSSRQDVDRPFHVLCEPFSRYNLSTGVLPAREVNVASRLKAVAGMLLAASIAETALAGDCMKLGRVRGPVQLDGASREAAWETIVPIRPVMLTPEFGGTPSERTELLLAYDENNLYVAGRLYDHLPGVRANSKQRDSGDASSDWFGVVIDPFNDKENGLAFFTTPAGLRWDAAILHDTEVKEYQNWNWDGFWDVATTRTAEGWFVEFRIPFSTLRLQGRGGASTFGVIAWRSIARKEEAHIFPAIRPDWGFRSRFKVSRAQEVAVEGIAASTPTYVTPYVLGGVERAGQAGHPPALGARNAAREVGLDVKRSLGKGFTLDLTANTDFAQVEADDQQVNLSRFPLFFPEKRRFFQERGSTFDFAFGEDRVFDSRRIGIVDQRPVRLYGGGRLVGRSGKWDIGALDMQSAASGAAPAENSGVFRVRREVLDPTSYLGVITTSRIDAAGRYNLVYGADGALRARGDDYVTFGWVVSDDTGDPAGSSLADRTRLRVMWQRRREIGAAYYASYGRVGADYSPGLGYQKRKDFGAYSGAASYGWLPAGGSRFYSHRLVMDAVVLTNSRDGAADVTWFHPKWEWSTKGGYSGSIAGWADTERVPATFALSGTTVVSAGSYRHTGADVAFDTPGGRSAGVQALVSVGRMYDAPYLSLRASPKWNASSSVELSGSYQYTRIESAQRDLHYRAHLVRLRALVMFDTRLSVSAFVQHNTVAGSLAANLRLRYNPAEGIDLYIVYNELLATGPARRAGGEESRTLLAKYVYTFNLR